MPNLANPRSHFRLGVYIENAEKNLFVRVDNLLHAPFDHIRAACREFWSKPAVLESREHGWDSLGAHRGDNAPHLRGIVLASKRCRAVQAERQHTVGIASSICGADHPPERMPGKMSFFYVQLAAQAFQILNEIIETIRRFRQRR